MRIKLLISFLAALILFAGALNTKVNTLIMAAQLPARQCQVDIPFEPQSSKTPFQKCNTASYCGPSASYFNGLEDNVPQWGIASFKKHKGNTPVINNYYREYTSTVWQPPDVLLLPAKNT